MSPAPTVGRIVHFYDTSLEPHANNGMGKGPYAAIVTQVFPGPAGAPSPYANLKVLVPFGDDRHVGSVPEQGSVHHHGVYSWTWPPREAAAGVVPGTGLAAAEAPGTSTVTR